MLLIIYFVFLRYPMPFDTGVLSTSNAVYTGGFLTVYPVQISTVDPFSLGFVLSTSHAIDNIFHILDISDAI